MPACKTSACVILPKMLEVLINGTREDDDVVDVTGQDFRRMPASRMSGIRWSVAGALHNLNGICLKR